MRSKILLILGLGVRNAVNVGHLTLTLVAGYIGEVGKVRMVAPQRNKIKKEDSLPFKTRESSDERI